MNRRTVFFTIGSVAALIMVTLVALGFGGDYRSAAAQSFWGTDIPASIGAMTLVTDPSGGASLEQIQAENVRLRTVLTTMQARETTYRQQVEAANQALLAQQSPNTAAITETVPAQGSTTDDDDGPNDVDDGPNDIDGPNDVDDGPNDTDGPNDVDDGPNDTDDGPDDDDGPNDDDDGPNDDDGPDDQNEQDDD